MSGKMASYDMKFSVPDAGHTAGTSTITVTGIDMQDAGGGGGYDGILLIVSLGTVTSGSVLSLQAQDSAVSGSGYANVGSAATITDSGGATSNQLLIVDVTNVQKRYVGFVLGRNTANAVINNVVAIRYRAKHLPVTQDSTVAAIAQSNAAS